MSPIKVGVVGYGFAAKSFHLPFINAVPALQLHAILQRAPAPETPSSAAAGSHCTVDFPNVKHHRTADEFFADDFQLVVVATKDDTHMLFAEKAILAGKHALVDKPFARTSAEADKVIELAKERGLILTCFQNRRFDGDFKTLRQLVSKNALGQIVEAEFHYDFESPFWLKFLTETKYTPGAGLAFGLGAHTLDQALTLFGRPKSVTSFYRVHRGIESEVEDAFTIILQYDKDQKDLLVTVKTTTVTPMPKQLKLLVRGREGSYVKWQQRSTCPQEEQIEQGLKPLDPGFGKEPESMQGTLTTYKEFDASVQKFDPETQKYTGKYPTLTGRWVEVYENVADAINGKAELAVKPTQSRDAIRLLELARQSHEKQTTVEWS